MHPVSPGSLHSLRVINVPAPLWRDPFSVTIRNMQTVYTSHTLYNYYNYQKNLGNPVVHTQPLSYPDSTDSLSNRPIYILHCNNTQGDWNEVYEFAHIEALCICTVNCLSILRLLMNIPCWAVPIVEMIDNSIVLRGEQSCWS